jgi:hypothetical protein
MVFSIPFGLKHLGPLPSKDADAPFSPGMTDGDMDKAEHNLL